jgi:hypothetical protein
MQSRALQTYAVVLAMLAILLGAPKEVAAQVDFTSIQTNVVTAKTSFLTLFKIVIELVGLVIVVIGAVKAMKKIRNQDPHADDAIVGTAFSAGILIVVVLLW